jgi:hypothetical protein
MVVHAVARDAYNRLVIEPWADSPLKDPNKDKLDRAPFVKMTTQLIETLADSNDSTVLGLVGPWGSGKSTVLHYVGRQLAKDIKVVWFNPWSLDEDRLQAELYSAIISTFPRGSRKSARQKAVNVARRSTSLLKAIPQAGTALAETARAFIPAESWDAAFNDLAATIKAASVKTLVIVDDVDRLQPRELLELMKTVRLLGRFPRVNYVLAYDHKSTVDSLATMLGNEQTAAVYLEKIVQYPLDLPDPQQDYLQEIVQVALGPIVEKASAGMAGGPTPRIRFDSFYAEPMSATLTTPRACQRYILQAQAFLSLAEGDVDPADFFALTFLRLFHAKLYMRLPGWIEELTTSEGEYARQTKPTSKDTWIARMKSLGYGEEAAVDLVEALASLFPRAFPDTFWSMAGGKNRAYKREYFQRYFTFSLPAGDVSDLLVQRDIDRILQSGSSLGTNYPETFDHPIEGVQEKALKKGTRDTDFTLDTRPLIDYLSVNLARNPGPNDRYSAPHFLKMQWLSKTIGTLGTWTAADAQKLVSTFDRPERLGYILHLHQAYTERSLGQLDAEANPYLDPTFARSVRETWNQQSVPWLIGQWRSPQDEVSDLERFEVWNYIVAFEGLSRLREATVAALKDQTVTLTAVATAFTVCPKILGDTEALQSSLTLVIPKLKDTVPLEMLKDLPLEPLASVAELKDGEMPSPVHRQNFAVQHLQKWREMRPEADGKAEEQ